jgi:hypothetical protein
VNPYTPIRRLAQALLAEVQGMVAEVTLLELQEAGARVVDTPAESAAPVDAAEGTPARRRGRKPKTEAPPPAPVEPVELLPRPRRGRPPREPRIPGAGFEPAG